MVAIFISQSIATHKTSDLKDEDPSVLPTLPFKTSNPMMTNDPSVNNNHPPNSDLIIKISAATLCRLVLNTARRFVYPFAPSLSRGLGVPLHAITSLIAVNQATGIFGFFLGPLADRIGYRRMMVAGMTMLAAGMLAAGVFPFYTTVLIGLSLAGFGKAIFDPAVQAYVSERVPFRRRALAIGFLEFSWAGSALVGIPLVAFLIDRFQWRSPFLVMGSLGMIGAVILWLLIPREQNLRDLNKSSYSFKMAWHELTRDRSALGALGFYFLIGAANDNLFVVYGAWLENSFNLTIVALGLGTSVIGIAELAGEVMTAAVADRLGLKRAVNGGMILCIICYGLLPFMDGSLSMVLAGLFFLFLAFEFTVVASISLATELLPEYRATMMASFLAAAGIGRVVGALIGGPIWLAGGIAATCLVSAAINCLGLISLRWGLHGWRQR
jgi:predicted MFS family arabinose efflux permease